MKALILALGTAALLTACGTKDNGSSVESAHGGMAPDSYSCTTDDGLNISYSSSSLDGQPELYVTQVIGGDATFTLLNVRGEQLSRTTHGSKTVLSGSTYIPDLKTTVWSIEIPKLTVSGFSDVKTFKADLKQVDEPTSIMGPLPGQHSTTTVHHATCQAQFVEF